MPPAHSTVFRPFQFALPFLCLATAPVRAAVDGVFTYRIVDGATVEIIGCLESVVGPVTIPDVIAGKPVTSIGDDAFDACAQMTSVMIPASMTSIGYTPFPGCPQLSSISIAPGNPAFVAVDGVVFDAALETVICCLESKSGGYVIPATVSSIRDTAFLNCTNLTSLIIPPNVTSIGRDVFYRCSGLTSVSLPSNLTAIPEGTFSICTGLTSVSIPAGVTSIGDRAFASCIKLTSITLSSNLTSIGHNAFHTCDSLTSVTIPSGITSISPGTFESCGKLTNVTIPNSVTSFGARSFADCRLLASISIPPSVSVIGSGAFSGCWKLRSITLPPGITSISGGLFSYCSGLTSVTIPCSVTSIGGYAFSGCSNLPAVQIPFAVTSIGESAFARCAHLSSVTLPPSITSIGFGAFQYCTVLTKIFYLGNAPILGLSQFLGTASGFTQYYLSSKAGFTSPIWQDYPAVMINEEAFPAASWMLIHQLPYDADLNQDVDGDGVRLLMAYALNLDPNQSQQSGLPVPQVVGSTLSLKFYGAAQGITYRVETSTDLLNWTTSGVTQSAPGLDGQITATVVRDTSTRFLHLEVEH